MDRSDDLAERLGLPIRDQELIAQALTHASWMHEHPGEAAGHNERLEFLGDAVINLAVSRALYLAHPTDDEGLLSSRRAAIVSTTGLARLGSRLGIGDDIRLGQGEARRDARIRPSLLASALEAIVGAVALDAGYEAAADWLTTVARPELDAKQAPATLKSPKSRLQELTQRRAGSRPEYRLVGVSGPDHERVFEVEVQVEGTPIGSGTGASRRIAETLAAARALETLAGDPSTSRDPSEGLA